MGDEAGDQRYDKLSADYRMDLLPPIHANHASLSQQLWNDDSDYRLAERQRNPHNKRFSEHWLRLLFMEWNWQRKLQRNE